MTESKPIFGKVNGWQDPVYPGQQGQRSVSYGNAEPTLEERIEEKRRQIELLMSSRHPSVVSEGGSYNMADPRVAEYQDYENRIVQLQRELTELERQRQVQQKKWTDFGSAVGRKIGA